MCFQVNYVMAPSNHPLNFEEFFDKATQISMRLRKIKEARTMSILTDVGIYLAKTMSLAELEFLQDEWEYMTGIFQRRQEIFNRRTKCRCCSKETTKRCSICGQDNYCSSACQSSNWKEHKILCHSMGVIRFTCMNATIFDSLIDNRKDGGNDIEFEEMKKTAMAKLTVGVLKAKVDYLKTKKQIYALV